MTIPTPRIAPDDSQAAGSAPVNACGTIDDLRRRRSALACELRETEYSRRILKAQTDLIVASLLYDGHDDSTGLAGTSRPSQPPPDAGARLELLRARDTVMAMAAALLREQLDSLTSQLVTRIADARVLTNR